MTTSGGTVQLCVKVHVYCSHVQDKQRGKGAQVRNVTVRYIKHGSNKTQVEDSLV